MFTAARTYTITSTGRSQSTGPSGGNNTSQTEIFTLSIPQTSGASLPVTLLPLDGRVANLMEELMASRLFNEEEMTNLFEASAGLDENQTNSLTFILLRTIHKSIIRFGDDEQELLFTWEETLRNLILETLPRGASIDAHIENFKTTFIAASKLQRKQATLEKTQETKLNALYSKFNEVNVKLRGSKNLTRAACIEIRDNRLASISSITEKVLKTSKEQQDLLSKQHELTHSAIDMFQQDARGIAKLSDLYSTLLTSLEGLDV